jgi:hypothetical protein
MSITYTVKITIVNAITNEYVSFNKNFTSDINVDTDKLLYDNNHVLNEAIYVLDLFPQEVTEYCKDKEITTANIEIDEYEINTITERAEVYFENPDDPNVFTLNPCIKCYIYPKEEELKIPTLTGKAIDSNTIMWTWPDDETYMHYLITEPLNIDEDVNTSEKIIATIPIGATQYIETGLEPNTPYTRRLINYTATQTSLPSGPITVTTETVNPTYSLSEYFINREQDWTITDEEREFVQENLEAFHSGVGDLLDCKVYKQSDTDFYEKFKGYFVLSGSYTEREKRYEQVNFRYKLLLDAVETIEEQEGEIDFKLDVYPWQEVYHNEYIWATMPINIYAKVHASIQVFETTTSVYEEEIEIKQVVETTEHNPLCIVITIDVSTSMRYSLDSTRENKVVNYERINTVKDAAIQMIEGFKKLGVNKPEYYIVSLFSGKENGNESYSNAFTNDADEAISLIESIEITNQGYWWKVFPENQICKDLYTIWMYGIVAWKHILPELEKTYGNIPYFSQLFFTDGFPTRPYTYGDENNFKNLAKAPEISYLLSMSCCAPEVGDPDNIANNETYNTNAKNKLSSISNKFTQATDVTGIQNAFNAAVTDLTTFTVEKEVTTTVKAEVPINSIKSKTINIESELLKFQFNNTNTPVVYNKDIKKVEILKTLSPTKMSTANGGVIKNIKTLLEEALEKELAKPEYAGYTTGNVNDGNGIPIGKIFKNVYIKDTYAFADEDNNDITGLDFSGGWQYGKMGSINTYTNIAKTTTPDHSDDEVVITEDSYVWIDGYTEGIIYDGIRYGHANVCKYTVPQVTMFFKDDIKNLLKNRLVKTFTYGATDGTVDSNHVFREVLSTKIPDPNYTQMFGNGIDEDMIIKIDKSWSSPRLKYRFNLMDPNAYTPYYEILPDCNAQSVDKHCVVLTVYKAENVFINSDNYISSFDSENSGENPRLYEYGLNSTWNSNEGIFDCNGQYINQWIHFQAAPMLKTQEYHDQLPPEGQELYYGMVNGRYRENNPTGKQDLHVEVPQFNIPTTVLATHADSVKIYIEITEMDPSDALIEYKWNNENPTGSGYTKVNGDFVTFTCESPTTVDIEHIDTISTYQTEPMELFDQKPYEIIKQFQKPEIEREYEHYYLEASTNNSDVMVAKYPGEILFDKNNICDVPITYQGIINATSQWAPRIHNGYFYFNQHEQYIYSEFNVQADFEQTALTNYDTENVFVTFKATLKKSGGTLEQYSLDKDTKVELLQDEANFTWVDKTADNSKYYGITLKPTISGFEYEHYEARTWTSPPISFQNCLTSDKELMIDYINTDGSNTGLNFVIRHYDIEKGSWQDWKDAVPFINGTRPSDNGVPLSTGYQIRTQLSATENHTEYKWDKYLCCYLDWLDYLDENTCKNINTATDHISVGPLKSNGIAISKVLDFGCKTGISLSMFSSKSTASMQIAFSNDKNDLLLENIKWQNISAAKTTMKYRFWRFKIEIPYAVNIYWVHINVNTLKSDVVLPFIQRIRMNGEYLPKSIEATIQNLESFEILADGTAHKIVDKIGNFIDADIIEKGFTRQNIKKLEIINSNPKCYLIYDNNLLLDNPNPDLLDTSILAAVDETKIEALTNTPYIKVKDKQITIIGTPQQYSPITVETVDGITLKQIYGASKTTMKLSELITISDTKNYIELKRTDFEKDTLQIWVNEEEIIDYEVVNHLIFFKDNLNAKDVVSVSYNILNSFYAEIDRENNITTIIPYENKEEWIKTDKKFKVMFETSTTNNKYKTNLSMNPVYRTEYEGFIYATYEHNEPYKIRIFCTTKRLKHGGKENTDINIEVVDVLDNPIINKEIEIDCLYGSIDYSSLVTDENGVVHLVYTSCYNKCTDKLTVKVINEETQTNLEESIEIVIY